MQRPTEDTAPSVDSQEGILPPTLWGDAAPAERAEGGPAGEGAASDAGTFSVTRPAQNTLPQEEGETEPRVLLAGIDTLDIGLYVEFSRNWKRIVAKLARLKQKARANGGEFIPRTMCFVLPSGKPNYPFLIQSPHYQLYLSCKSRPDGETPNAYLSLRAASLWHLGVEAALQAALTDLATLTDGSVVEARMSRCDLAVDVRIPGGLADGFIREHVVSKSESWRIQGKGKQFQTLYWGAAESPIQLRIYHKSLEVVVHDKLWFYDLWGGAHGEQVWRFEYQLRRSYLKDVQINSLADLVTRQAAIWTYLTTEWFSLRLLDDPHPTRRTVHPLWGIIQQAASRFGETSGKLQRSHRRPSPDPAAVLKQIESLTVGYGARCGVHDRQEVLEALWQELAARDEGTNFAERCQRKANQLGIDFQEIRG